MYDTRHPGSPSKPLCTAWCGERSLCATSYMVLFVFTDVLCPETRAISERSDHSDATDDDIGGHGCGTCFFFFVFFLKKGLICCLQLSRMVLGLCGVSHPVNENRHDGDGIVHPAVPDKKSEYSDDSDDSVEAQRCLMDHVTQYNLSGANVRNGVNFLMLCNFHALFFCCCCNLVKILCCLLLSATIKNSFCYSEEEADTRQTCSWQIYRASCHHWCWRAERWRNKECMMDKVCILCIGTRSLCAAVLFLHSEWQTINVIVWRVLCIAPLRSGTGGIPLHLSGTI